jgi:hypothetical protein
MKLDYIKADGRRYRPQEAGVKMPKSYRNYPVCKIKKLLLGRWMVEYYDDYDCDGYSFGDEDTPNKRVILYPAGIEEIRWSL